MPTDTTTRSADKLGPLMTQGEARAEARAMAGRGIACVAGTVPLGCWGGAEKGWTVYIGDPYAAGPGRSRG